VTVNDAPACSVEEWAGAVLVLATSRKEDLMETVREVRQRNRRIQQVSAELGSHYSRIEKLARCISSWQREIAGIERSIGNRREWIAQAKARIAELARQIEVLEQEYFGLNGEDS
jgi:chromosome segregation ATPase